NVFGIYIYGGGDSTTDQGTAFAVDGLSVTTNAKWTNGYASRAGASLNAFVAGPSEKAGTHLNSQPVVFQGISGGGATVTSKIFADGGGDLFVVSPPTGSVILGDAISNYFATVPAAGGAKVQLPALASAG